MRVRVAPATLAATVPTLTAPLVDPAEFVVDHTSEAVDADPPDGRCRTTSGECSLRAAVTAANARPASTITRSPGHDRLTIPPDLADREKAFATLSSLGRTIDGDGSCRLSAAGHLPSRDPLVGPLANHAGRTDTVALLPGSPGLDAAEGPPGHRSARRPSPTGCHL
ncbi:hypothetical protein L0M19_15270 [Streptomyces indiaensis]|uniref:Uncharacterized protein n=1 Tax=Streptomyces indiaensis TaxID=284033 RepID=A0ABN3DGL1_9ACTN|nr:choice-of-anchor Q domain-containing protein [Streptomyces indiaensis]MCF1646593.1 hypothetical protein [Streptomyces indiaensis]